MSDSFADLAVPPMDRAAPSDLSSAAFGMGCFWGPDALFGALDGVVRTCVGYAGGTTENPTYQAIGDHIETVRVAFDPEQISYDELLRCFWTGHSPTRAPFKRQYQPALFPTTDAQAERARETYQTVADRHDGTLTTEIIEAPSFYRAEPYHQKHSLRHYDALMAPFEALYPDPDAFADSPAAALVNGYVAGHRDPVRLADDRERLGLPAPVLDRLRTVAEQRYD